MPRAGWSLLLLFIVVGLGFATLGILINIHFFYLTAICCLLCWGVIQVAEEEQKKRENMNDGLVFLTIPKESFEEETVTLSNAKVAELENLLKVAKANTLGGNIKIVITHLERTRED